MFDDVLQVHKPKHTVYVQRLLCYQLGHMNASKQLSGLDAFSLLRAYD